MRGELDWIVMKALEKDRNRRYETANGFAADIERYLHDEPVQACPPSARYRFRKFARRNKAAFRHRLVLVRHAWLVAVDRRRRCIGGSNANGRHATRTTADEAASNVRRTTSYIQRIALAGRELAAGNVGRAEELLDECPTRPARLGVAFPQAAALRQPASHAARRDGRPRGLQPGRPAARHGLHGWDDRNSGCADRPGRCTRWSDRRSCSAAALLARHGLQPGWPVPGRRATTTERFESGIRPAANYCTPLEGHSGPAWQVAFSPDSRTLASGGSDRTVRLWDVTSGQALQVFSAHPSAVKGVAFRPDGRSVVAACDDGTVKVWDRETGRETFSFHGELLAYPWSAWFSPDARRLAWSCLDGFIKVWDTTTGRLEINQQSNTHQCRAVAFSPDGKRIAVAGFDGTIRLLDGCDRPRDADDLRPQQPRRRRDFQSRWPPARFLQLRSHGPHLGRHAL